MTRVTSTSFRTWVFRLACAWVSIATGFAFVEIAVRVHPDLIARTRLRTDLDNWRYWRGDLPNLKYKLEYRVSAGDLAGGSYEDEDRLFAQFIYQTAGDGFRNDPRQRTCSLMGLGDSFTGAAQVAE